MADDDVALCAALKFAFETEGYRVETCGSGEALLQLQLPRERACLIVDERLPGLTGLDALSQLRRRGVDLPAFVITTNPSASARLAAETLRAPIIEKPLLGDGLLDRIRGACPPDA
ncbi:response regulator [Phenylobacterium sp. J426]|uniref:response regulator transcription factor n=1 Tax=Phenylobacterium sp. J426 TaxID=2898439 RepID=UPI002151D5F2|nr:response regulator [Phenylobacterium sp. J426]MCR5876172.1 response regulator [Phenylobacterium sp. J426]